MAPLFSNPRSLGDTDAKDVLLGAFGVKLEIPAGTEAFVDPLTGNVEYNLVENAKRSVEEITNIRFSLKTRLTGEVIVSEGDNGGSRQIRK